MHKLYFFGLLMLLLPSCMFSEEVDTVFHNGKINYHNGLEWKSGQAMAIKDGKIIEIGPEREILNKYRAGSKIDLGQQYIFPSFTDNHMHFMPGALASASADLTKVHNTREMLDELEEFWLNNKGVKVLVGEGYNEEHWQGGMNQDLLFLINTNFDIPVVLKRADFHTAIFNKAALDLLPEASKKTSKNFVWITKGNLAFVRDELLFETLAKLPQPSKDQKLKYAQNLERELFTAGITQIANMFVSSDELMLLIDWYASNELVIEQHLYLEPSKENVSFLKEMKDKQVAKNLYIQGIKVIADGTFGSRTALLKEPYNDSTVNGYMNYTVDSVKQWLSLARKLDLQVATHAIGDSSLSVMLNLYQKYLENPDARWRMEHLQMVSPEDYQILRDKSIIASIQPCHLESDFHMAKDRIGDRMATAYPYSTLMDSLGLVVLGTDFPVEPFDALANMEDATFNRGNDGSVLTRKEALSGLTNWGALALFQESRWGSLSIGQEANFIIVKRDLLDGMIDLKEVYVSSTYIQGQKVN